MLYQYITVAAVLYMMLACNIKYMIRSEAHRCVESSTQKFTFVPYIFPMFDFGET